MKFLKSEMRTGTKAAIAIVAFCIIAGVWLLGGMLVLSAFFTNFREVLKIFAPHYPSICAVLFGTSALGYGFNEFRKSVENKK